MSSKKKSKKNSSAVLSPSSREISDSDCEAQFKVVSTPQKSTQQGNLTGPERKVKDSCADWHNYTEKWKTLNARGGQIVTEICNLRIASFDNEETDKKELFDKLDKFSKDLTSIYESLDKLFSKMRRLRDSFQGLNELLNQSSYDVLVQSWTIDRFVESSEELVNMYERELSLKKCIVENVCHSSSRDMAMFQLTAWLYDPYINKRRQGFLIEAMLLEVGLK